MAKESEKTKTRDDDKPQPDDAREMRAIRTSVQEDEEKKDRERLKKEHAEVTPEKLSELMTEKSKLKFDHEAEIKRLNDEHQQKIHELDIQIARGKLYGPGKAT